jgi:hypothetical protein
MSFFKYGVDTFYQCMWALPGSEVPFLERCINREETLHCRALMTPGHEFWVPFDMPIWVSPLSCVGGFP